MSAIVTYAAISAQGQELRAMQNRISWVLDTSGKASRVIHEHTSAPIGFEDAKAILKRERIQPHLLVTKFAPEWAGHNGKQ